MALFESYERRIDKINGVIGLEEGIGIIHAEVDGHKTDIAVYVLPVGDADVNDVYKNISLKQMK